MTQPYGRKTKKLVGSILAECTRTKALERLARIPDEQLVSHLFAHFYNKDELIKFRSTVAMGELALRMAGTRMERARVLVRRLMWNLNDESGGIGWGSPEALGEILGRSQELALEYKCILFSYLDPKGNFIEHPSLQQGVLWGIGTYMKAAPQDLNDTTRYALLSFLHSKDSVKRGYAVRALIHAGCLDYRLLPDHIVADPSEIDIFTQWNFIKTRISDMALACTVSSGSTGTGR